jgi:RNA polymerase sigma factor (sigma-70 family)
MSARTPDNVGPEARALFEKNKGLAYHFARKYARRWPTADLDELVQVCLDSLWLSCRKHDPTTTVPFGAYASTFMKYALWSYVAKLPGGKYGPKEISLETPLGHRDGGELTVLDAIEGENADRQISSAPGHDRLQARLFELRELIETLETLTPAERLVLRLRFIEGLSTEEIQRRTKRFPYSVPIHSSNGVRKLRTYFRRLGYSVSRGKLTSRAGTEWRR